MLLTLALGCFVDSGGATSPTTTSAETGTETTDNICSPGAAGCACEDGACLPGLACQGGVCKTTPGSTSAGTSTSSGSSTTGSAMTLGSTTASDETTGQSDCGSCPLLRPNVMFVLDYSASNNYEFGPPTDALTRWQALQQVMLELDTAGGGHPWANTNLAVMRFGHDPDPMTAGTTIPNDSSGIVDGQRVDHFWYDERDPQALYYECNDGLLASLAAIEPPLGGELFGIGTWTRGALVLAAQKIAQSQAAHPDELNDPPRPYAVVLVTDGEWTNANGLGQDPEDDPVLAAAKLNAVDGVPVHVIFTGAAGGTAATAAQDLAEAGGTTQALVAEDVDSLGLSVTSVLETILAGPLVVETECCDPACGAS